MLRDDPSSPPTSAGDAALAAQLRATRCTGTLWELTSAIWGNYTTRTLHGLVLNGQLNARLDELRLRGARLRDDESQRLRVVPLERDDLVGEAVGDGLVRMRDDALLGGRWTVAGRASLTTWCVDTTLVGVPSAIRRWRATRRSPMAVLHEDIAELEAIGLVPPPHPDTDAASERLEEVIAEMPHPLNAIFTCWRKDPDLGFAGAAHACGVPRSTAYRLYSTFRAERLLLPARRNRDPEDPK